MYLVNGYLTFGDVWRPVLGWQHTEECLQLQTAAQCIGDPLRWGHVKIDPYQGVYGRISHIHESNTNITINNNVLRAREREMFYLTTHSTHFIYGYMASDIWLKTILIVRKETHCRHIGYSYRLTARVLLYAPSHRQDSTYHGLCYTSCGALAGTRNSSMGPPHEGSIRRPIAPWANALPMSYVPLPCVESIIK